MNKQFLSAALLSFAILTGCSSGTTESATSSQTGGGQDTIDETTDFPSDATTMATDTAVQAPDPNRAAGAANQGASPATDASGEAVGSFGIKYKAMVDTEWSPNPQGPTGGGKLKTLKEGTIVYLSGAPNTNMTWVPAKMHPDSTRIFYVHSNQFQPAQK